ncbi:4089_t:CDS:2 [Diversispora eburnea]|uniref:4089_t:CDS:1 n=1 Tax=Diversispora eburnea TaxID=1213867 RepID=A0A9N8ZTM0_9GLOM|nr:4089_t:CDS:2 [Diversispora eburnea]
MSVTTVSKDPDLIKLNNNSTNSTNSSTTNDKPKPYEVKCKDLIKAHKACMRSYGFNV